MSVRAELLEYSLSVAAKYGDPAPSDIEAVATTYGQASQACHCSYGRTPTNTAVYVVALRGEFKHNCPSELGETVKCIPLPVMELQFLAANVEEETETVGAEGIYPDLAKLGAPIDLS